MKTAAQISLGIQLHDYALHVRQWEERYRWSMQQRQQEGMVQAQAAATILKQDFGAREVFLFGSLLTPEQVHADSDIDLGVWGLDLDRYCEAVGTLLCQIDGFNVDVVMLEVAQSGLVEHILSQGVRM